MAVFPTGESSKHRNVSVDVRRVCCVTATPVLRRPEWHRASLTTSFLKHTSGSHKTFSVTKQVFAWKEEASKVGIKGVHSCCAVGGNPVWPQRSSWRWAGWWRCFEGGGVALWWEHSRRTGSRKTLRSGRCLQQRQREEAVHPLPSELSVRTTTAVSWFTM